MVGFWGRIEMDIARMRYRELLQGKRHQQQLSREKVKRMVSSTEGKRYRAKYPRRSVRAAS